MLKCPDCGAEITKVIVEWFSTQEATVDENRKIITCIGSPASPNDFAYHCPGCDSLNIDELIRKAGYRLN